MSAVFVPGNLIKAGKAGSIQVDVIFLSFRSVGEGVLPHLVFALSGRGRRENLVAIIAEPLSGKWTRTSRMGPKWPPHKKETGSVARPT
jgi:hypothetical protein